MLPIMWFIFNLQKEQLNQVKIQHILISLTFFDWTTQAFKRVLPRLTYLHIQQLELLMIGPHKHIEQVSVLHIQHIYIHSNLLELRVCWHRHVLRPTSFPCFSFPALLRLFLSVLVLVTLSLACRGVTALPRGPTHMAWPSTSVQLYRQFTFSWPTL
jgi:hypothetical protein